MLGKRFITLVALTLWLTASSAWAGYTRVNTPNPADPMDVHIFRLDNGLTVYLTENHETPRFHAEITVRAGSKNDPAEATGLAHYLEHMLFKGTRNMGTLDYAKEKPYLDRITALYEQHYSEKDSVKRKAIYREINKEAQKAARHEIPNELDKLYKSMGGIGLNAATSQEYTTFMVNLPSNRLRQWAAIESERFRDPVFRLFQPELEVVYEEKNRTLDSKERLIYYAVLKQLFKVHPYGQQPTIGTVEHLKNPSLKRMYEFYHTYYVPNNMALILSGDFHVPEAIEVIDKYFSVWQRKALPKPKHWKEPPLHGAERVTVQYPGEEYVMLAFRTLPDNHPDAEAMQLVDMTLDNATAGLINLNLNQKQKVRRAGCSPSLNNDYGFEYLWGIPKQGQSLEEVERLLLEQVELVKQGKFEDWIIPAIINDFKKNQKAGLEANSRRVGWMRSAYVAYEDWDHAVAGLDRMAKLTKADLIRVANTYFGADYVAGYRVNGQHKIPPIEKPKIDKIDIDPTRQSAFVAQIRAMPVEPIEPVFVNPGTDYKLVDYAKGVKVYYAKNPLNDLFSLSISFDIGRRHQDKLGAAAMLLDKSGTLQYSPEDLQKEWYKLGTTFNIGVGDYTTTISISGLDENFTASLALLMDYVRHPIVDTATLEGLIDIILINREDAKKNFRTIQSALVQYNRYGRDSRFLKMTPNEEIRKLTVDELHGLIRDLFTYEHTISYTGTLPVDRLVAALKKYHPVAGPLKPPPPFPFLKARRPEKTEILFFNKEMAQAQVRIEFGGEVYDEARNPAMQLYNNYFGGDMSSIVFQELREARALAYAADARYIPGSRKGDQNIMVGVIGTQADKTPEAVGAFIDLMDHLPRSPERFAAVRQSILNRYRTSKLGFRSVLGAVRSWERLALPVDPRRWRFEQIQHADIEQMLRFHADQIKGRPKLISILGDKNKIDMKALAKYGNITEVGLKDIFIF